MNIFQHQRMCQQIGDNVKKIHAEIFKLKEMNEHAKPVDVAALEDDAERMQEQIQALEAELEDAQRQASEAKEKFQQLQVSFRAKESEAEAYAEGNDPILDKLAKIDKAIEERELERQKAEERLGKSEDRKAAMDEVLQEFKSKVCESNENAKIIAGKRALSCMFYLSFCLNC